MTEDEAKTPMTPTNTPSTGLQRDDIVALIQREHAKTNSAATAAAIEFAQDEIVSIVMAALTPRPTRG